MRQTHKFKALQDVAAIVAGASSVAAAALQLGVQRSTVHRWVESGKVPRPRGQQAPSAPPEVVAEVVAKAETQSPAEWAVWVRATYALNQTDLMLLDLAERALLTARDVEARDEVNLAAMARYQQLVRQLNLQVEAEKAADRRPPVVAAPRRADPRSLLRAVK